MPTGYTAAVVDGTLTDFPTFALRCARAMGACIMQRDDVMTDLPKLRDKATYYERQLADATARLAELDAMTAEQADAAAQADYAHALAEWEKHRAKVEQRAARLIAMRSEVQAWTPPTPEHQGLKDFMLDQLRQTLDFDGRVYLDKPLPLSGPAYRARELGTAARNESYARERLAKDARIVEDANRWIAALYQSVGVQVPAAPEGRAEG